LMDLYPSMSPAEIKSALASTAVGGLSKEDGATPADPFDVGSGLLNLAGAGKVGLVFDETYANYVAANPAIGGDPKTLNQPSLVNYNCAGSCSWTRTVKAVVNGSWDATSTTPYGMNIQIIPSNFSLNAGESQALTFQLNVTDLPVGQWAFASVTLTPTNPVTPATQLPVVIKPVDLEPDISVTPLSLTAIQKAGVFSSQSLTIANNGSAPLNWEISEAPLTMRIELSPDSPEAADAPYALIVDDGLGENSVGLTNGGQFLWLNRFTPLASRFPISIDRVEVMFGYPGSSGGVNVGELVDIYLYEDEDGNPVNGATHRSSLTNQAVQAVDGNTWSVYNLSAPVSFTGPGDILIAVVNRTAGVAVGTFPAVIDQTAPSQQRSWAGFGAVPGNPPVLPLPTFGIIDTFGFPGNWLVRGFGEAIFTCDSPADVPWLSVDPSSGVITAGTSTQVTVGFDSTGLAAGDYEAVVCIDSNDPQTPLIELPVSLTVEVTYAVELDPEEESLSAEPGETVEYTLILSNTGNVADTFGISKTGDDWVTLILDDSFSLDPGESTEIIVQITIPAGANFGDFDEVTIIATSTGDPEQIASAVLMTTVKINLIYLPAIFK